MNTLKSILIAAAVVALAPALLTQDAQAQHQRPAVNRCNPPAPNLEFQAWYGACEGVLRDWFVNRNPYRLPYSEYVRMIWQMYEVQYHPERHPSLPGQPCSPEGSGYMNQSGHAQICRGGRWTVGGY